MKLPVTMADLAKRAGVSIATISLVISDHPRISPDTKKKVREIMEELHYVPNSIARGLVNQSLKTVGVVMSLGSGQALKHPYIFEMLSGMEAGLREGGYQMLLHHWDVWKQSPRELVNLWEQKRVDGFILQLTEPLLAHLKDWKTRGLPFMLIGNPGAGYGVDWVDADNETGGHMAWEKIRGAGYLNPGFIGVEGDGIHGNRARGFYEAAAREGKQPPCLWVKDGSLPEEIRAHALPDCDSLVCASHYLALTLNDGRRGILTFDNLPYMEYLTPSLSTVDIDVFTLGHKAAEGLVQKLRNPDFKLTSCLALTRFIPRNSTRKL